MAYRSSTTNTGSGSTLTGNLPSGVVANDVLVCFIGNNFGALSTNTDWTAISDSGSVNEPLGALFYRVATGSEPSSWTWTVGYADWIVQISAYSGIDNVTPIHAQSASWSREYGTSTSASITTTVASDIIQVACVANQTGTYSFNAALTPRQNQQGYYFLGALADSVNAAAGSYTYTVNATADAQWQRSYMIALDPDTGPPPSALPRGLTLLSQSPFTHLEV